MKKELDDVTFLSGLLNEKTFLQDFLQFVDVNVEEILKMIRNYYLARKFICEILHDDLKEFNHDNYASIQVSNIFLQSKSKLVNEIVKTESFLITNCAFKVNQIQLISGFDFSLSKLSEVKNKENNIVKTNYSISKENERINHNFSHLSITSLFSISFISQNVNKENVKSKSIVGQDSNKKVVKIRNNSSKPRVNANKTIARYRKEDPLNLNRSYEIHNPEKNNRRILAPISEKKRSGKLQKEVINDSSIETKNKELGIHRVKDKEEYNIIKQDIISQKNKILYNQGYRFNYFKKQSKGSIDLFILYNNVYKIILVNK